MCLDLVQEQPPGSLLFRHTFISHLPLPTFALFKANCIKKSYLLENNSVNIHYLLYCSTIVFPVPLLDFHHPNSYEQRNY